MLIKDVILFSFTLLIAVKSPPFAGTVYYLDWQNIAMEIQAILTHGLSYSVYTSKVLTNTMCQSFWHIGCMQCTTNVAMSLCSS